jgi:hypothetical protein
LSYAEANHVVAQACDACYKQRRKCDVQKPRCSNCVLHDSSCAFGASSRKARARRQVSRENSEALQLRIASLEADLGRATKTIEDLQRFLRHDNGAVDALEAVDIDFDAFGPRMNLLAEEALYESMELPSLQEVLSATNIYLTTFNATLPLFHPGRLLQMVHDWYRYPGYRPRTTWAAINVVLALACRASATAGSILSRGTAYYLHNAQIALTEVIMGETTLLDVQILIGMTVLLQGTQDLKPAAMLIAVAVRLAHDLHLHIGGIGEFDESQSLERSRVFWIAYILDRQISMRRTQPPVQRDADISLDWPSAAPDDGAGDVIDADSSATFNVFRCQVWLAHIQGQVYDFMVASCASKRPLAPCTAKKPPA